MSRIRRRDVLTGAATVGASIGAGVGTGVGTGVGMGASWPGTAAAAERTEAGCPPVPGPFTVTPDDPRYAEMVRADNYRFTGAPEYFRLVGSSDQVEEALSEAVRAGKRTTVRSGGHCLEGFVADPAVEVVLDTSPMSGVWFDADRDAFVLEAGVTLGEVYKTLYRNWGVTLPSGTCAAVGAGGHICGGGYGPLSRLHGLVIDYLEAVEVVVVDDSGNTRTVIASRDPGDPNHDLWWAHTGGGGGNFGIVTRYWMRDPHGSSADPAALLPPPPDGLLIAEVTWPSDLVDKQVFGRVVRNFQRWHERHSEPDSPAIGLFSSLWCPHRAAGDLAMTVQMDAGAPNAERVVTDYLDAVNDGIDVDVSVRRTELPWLTGSRYLGRADSGPVMALRSKAKAAYLRQGYTDEQIAIIWEQLNREDYAPTNSLMLIVGYGGRINAVDAADTAIPQRDSILKVLYSAFWTDPDEDETHIGWLRDFYTTLFAETGGVPTVDSRTDGSYINYPDVDLADPEQNTSGVPWHQLYYKDGYRRLQRVKRQWDPANIFQHALSIRPD